MYDRLSPRRFEFVPLWGLRVFLLYAMRRVDCPRCGVTVERVPWADGKHQLTTTYRWFLARWAKRLVRERPDGPETARWIAERRTSDEGQEGLRAFLEKRPASWRRG